MISIFFLMFLVISIFLVNKYNSLQREFFLAIEKLDDSQLIEFGLYDDNAFRLHLNRIRYFNVKPYLKFEDEKVKSIAKSLNILNRLSAASIVICIALAALKFLNF
ncbi:hypothetical protein [Gynuella sunshinyii]|nr:hypothetical protein [Gynuella sunshinyii]